MSDELRPHQLLALRKLSNGKVLWGGVGSGKSHVAAHYYKEHEAPRDVYVITTAKKRDSFDWQELFYRLDIGPKSGPSLHGDGLRKGRHSSKRDADADAGQPRPATGSVLRGSNQEGRSNAGGGNGVLENAAPHGGLQDASSSRERQTDLLGTGADVQQRAYLDEQASGAGGPSHLRGTSGGADSSRTSATPLGRSSGTENDIRDRNGGSAEGYRRDAPIGDNLDGRSDATVGFPGQEGSYPWVLTVDSWNNISKYADVAGAFFIFDEQRLVGSGDWSRKFLRIAKRNHWILLSGTPGDTWMDYVPLFVANNFYKNRTEFKREHVVYNTFTKFPKVDRYINVGRLARQRAALLVEMPYVRHTRRRHVEVPLPYDKDALDLVLKKRWHVYEERPLRDVAEMFSVARKVVNSDPSRLEMVKELWENHPKLIVFYNFNYELEALRTLSQSRNDGLITPSSNGKQISSTGRNKFSKTSGQLQVIDTKPGLLHGKKQDSRTSSTPTGGPPTSTVPSTSSGWTTTSSGLVLRGQDRISDPNTSKALVSGLRSPYEKPLLKKSTRQSTSTQTDLPNLNKSGSFVGNDPLVGFAEWNGHKHQEIPKTDRWLYLVQYVAGAEAWECTETDVVIFYSRNYSWKIWEQAQGRIDRLNTPFKDLWYYNFTSDSFIDRAIERSMRGKETFNEAKYVRMFKG